MIEMPPLQFAQVNGIRMGFYEAGPKTDKPPVVLCHGWPELAFSWRHQIKALSEAGIRVIAPDQRGYGASDRPEPVEDYDMEHLTGDLVGLLDHLKIDKAIFVGHDWGGFVVWQMPLRHASRVAGVVGVNTPHWPRAPVDPIALFRQRFGDHMYIVQFQDPSREPDKIFGSRVEQTFDAFMRKPAKRSQEAPADQPVAGLDHTVRVPSLMIMAENDHVLPPSAADGMEKLVPDLEKYLVRDSGHWTQQEQPEEVSAKLIEWRRRRFG